MKRILFLMVLALFISESEAQRGRDLTNPNPQTNGKPSDKEIEKMKRRMEERKEEYIANFLSTLEADDFQKQIIKQSLEDFHEAKLKILKTRFERVFEREEAIKNLEKTHFIELKELISESDMKKIEALINGDFDEDKVKKKRKRKRKNRN